MGFEMHNFETHYVCEEPKFPDKNIFNASQPNLTVTNYGQIITLIGSKL